jgi:hypothetical protein
LGKETYCVGLLPLAELSWDVVDLGELVEESLVEALALAGASALDATDDLRA